MNLILFDDHGLFGSTLQRALLQYDKVNTVIFVHTEEELIEALQDVENPMLLLDINLRKAGVNDSFALAKNLIHTNSVSQLIFLSGYDLPMYRKKARQMGAKGFFSKEISVEELWRGLCIIENGGCVFRREDQQEAERLTPTEIEVLILSAKGMSRQAIGDFLYISNRTVGRHLSNIFEKLEVKNITEAISVALNEGHIPPIF